MKNLLSLIALLLLLCVTTYAQSPYSIKGAAVDSAAKAKLLNATVMVLNAKDSILKKFTRADAEGNFAINNMAPGKYTLIMSYPDYADYSETFTLVPGHKTHDFGKVNMQLKSRLLQDIIIKGTVTAIKIKGDTTEFNARAYTIQPNDKAEDLIRQFPGIQIDKDGKITAQGQAVTKVLLDGEEFFGDDPTLVTKTIRADMIDKVQLYDKKSDQATFTGVDDGVKTKTMNIKLKEGKNSGQFGKVDAGLATNKFYQGQILYNQFNAKKKFSAYGTIANTGKTGLGWQDSQKYGDGNPGAGGDELESFDGRYNNQGIPVANTGGLHYDNKWNSDKESINTNYKIGSLSVDGVRNSTNINNLQSSNNLPDSTITTKSDQTFHNYIFRQKLDVTYQLKLDTTSDIKIMADGTLKNNNVRTSSAVLTRDNTGALLNSNTQSVDNKGDQNIFNASVFYTKKLKKKGRTLSVLLGGSVNDNDSKGFLYAKTDFYTAGVVSKSQLTDQYKTNISKNTVFNSNITYTEPISTALTLVLNYGLNVNNNNLDRRSYSALAATPTNYNVLVDSLTNNFNLNQLANQVGVIFNYKKGKSTFNIGSRASDVAFKQINQTGAVFKRHFINWFPTANYQLRISQQQSLSISYYGNTNQPSINQIQPVKDNTNPLNTYIGNPTLKPSFNNSINMYYNSFKVLSAQYLSFGGYFSFTDDPIVNNRIFKSGGVSTTQSVNLLDKTPYNYNLNVSYGRMVPGIEVNVGLNTNVSGSKNYTYGNNGLNVSNSGTYSVSVSFDKYLQKKYSVGISVGPNYNLNTTMPDGSADKTKQINNSGSGLFARGMFNVFLPAKFQIGSDINYTYRAKTADFGTDFRRTLWNATVSRTFLKDNTLKFALSANDLLNQNVGFDRSANGNVTSESSYTTIQRYFMASITWDFNRMGGSSDKK